MTEYKMGLQEADAPKQAETQATGFVRSTNVFYPEYWKKRNDLHWD